MHMPSKKKYIYIYIKILTLCSGLIVILKVIMQISVCWLVAEHYNSF